MWLTVSVDAVLGYTGFKAALPGQNGIVSQSCLFVTVRKQSIGTAPERGEEKEQVYIPRSCLHDLPRNTENCALIMLVPLQQINLTVNCHLQYNLFSHCIV